jgi:hypothetical protein
MSLAGDVVRGKVSWGQRKLCQKQTRTTTTKEQKKILITATNGAER